MLHHQTAAAVAAAPLPTSRRAARIFRRDIDNLKKGVRTAVSRILSAPCFHRAGRSFISRCALSCDHGSAPGFLPVRLLPGNRRSIARPDRSRLPRMFPVLSCTAWGFSCPSAYALGGELLPRLFTLTGGVSPAGGLFSVTLSVTSSFRLRPPRVLRGMLPCGVRTFLQRAGVSPDAPAIARRPQGGKYAPSAAASIPVVKVSQASICRCFQRRTHSRAHSGESPTVPNRCRRKRVSIIC